jgi:predicted nucleic acid-binding Zn ribbon protein
MEKLSSILAQTASVQTPKSVATPPISTAQWEQAVGTRIASRAQPLRIERGVLYVRVATAAWANELSLLSTEILAQLDKAGIEASALRFSVGPVETRCRGPRGVPQVAASPQAKVPAELSPVIERVDDESLRNAIRDAAAKSLSVSNKAR